jgi:hypothetical protein
MLASYRTVVSCASRARDVDGQLVFSRLNGSHWYGSAPFQELTYPDFVARLAGVVRRNLALGPAQRLLFKPWLTAHDVPAIPAASGPQPPNARRLDAPRLAAGAQSR